MKSTSLSAGQILVCIHKQSFPFVRVKPLNQQNEQETGHEKAGERKREHFVILQLRTSQNIGIFCLSSPLIRNSFTIE